MEDIIEKLIQEDIFDEDDMGTDGSPSMALSWSTSTSRTAHGSPSQTRHFGPKAENSPGFARRAATLHFGGDNKGPRLKKAGSAHFAASIPIPVPEGSHMKTSVSDLVKPLLDPKDTSLTSIST